MPPSEFLPPEFPEPGKDVGQLGQNVPNARIEAQLTNQPADVSQAHQFFAPRADGGLPNVSLGDGGASAAAANMPHGILAGGEHALTGVMGAEKAAFAAMAPAPGAEQGVSPLIQMILKMPGLTGFLDSLFEFLKGLFSGDLIGSLTEALLDPTGLMMHLFQEGGDFTIPMNVVSNNNPMLTFKDNMFMPSESTAMKLHTDLLGNEANVGAPISNVDLQQAIFEKTSNYTISDYHQNSLLDWHGSNNLALGPDSGAYRPTMGAYQAPAATTTGTTPPAVTPQHVNAHHVAHNTHHGTHHAAHHAAKHFKVRDVGSETHLAQATPTDAVNGQYTVQSGDNLWDIAKHNLGDGSRWGEIYRMNADVIGQNPDLIHPGTVLQMPDANSIANAGAEAGKYVVQPGDNLWNIAQHHMGGGQNWGELYRMNESVIGGNPRLIMPGQELSLGGGTDAVAAAAPAASADPSMMSASAGTQAAAPPAVAHDPIMQNAAAANPSVGTPETPQLAPVNNFANSAQVGNETTINSTTQVPSTAGDGNTQMYTSQDGSLFYRQKPQ